MPLYDTIVCAARDAGLAGVTVLRGIAGYGRSTHLHETFRGFANDLPIVVEIIDSRKKIDAWLGSIGDMLRGAIATIEKIRLVQLTPPASAPRG